MLKIIIPAIILFTLSAFSYLCLDYRSFVKEESSTSVALAFSCEDCLGQDLLNHNFERLEKQFRTALATMERNKDGEYLLHELMHDIGPDYSDDASLFKPYIQAIEKWIETYPDSEIAYMCMGNAYYNYGYNARGTGYAHEVPRKNWKLFRKRVKIAAEFTLKSLEIDPNNNIALNQMISIAKHHPDWPDSQMEEWFLRAISVDPSDVKFYRTKLFYLVPKWGSSDNERFQFARKTVETAPENSMAPVILATAHWEKYLEDCDPEYFKNRAVWREMQHLYDELVRRFPESNKRHNWYARTAYLAGDFAVAKREFNLIGENWGKDVWETYDNFDSHRQYVQ